MSFIIVLIVAAGIIWFLNGGRAPSAADPGALSPGGASPDPVRPPATTGRQLDGATPTRGAPGQARPQVPAPPVPAPPRSAPAAAPAATRRATAAAPARWVPPGEAVPFAGHHLPGGMLYVGTGLGSVSAMREAEPALLDPGCPISHDPAEAAYATAPYWPSYSGVSAAFRAKYLRWLAEGRRDPKGDVSCVFLFFYGIERRVLVDAESDPRAAAEVPALLAEVERLLEVYGDNGSFRGYAGNFLEFARTRHALAHRGDPAAAPDPNGATWLEVRVALGRFAVERRPIPADWALAWLESSGQWSPRTAAQRCPDEFQAAFRLRYRERFGDGMVLRPNRKRLTLEYVPASASFAGQAYRLSLGELPDVGALTAPVDRLRQVADAATEAIDRYSRFLGRGGEENSLAALGLLPPEVLRRKVRREPPPLVADVASALRPEGRGLIGSRMLVGHWPSAKPDRLTRKEAEGVAEFLEKLGIGIAPDARHTGINLSQSGMAALFLLPAQSQEPGPDFANATLLLTLAAAVAGSDEIARGEEEEIERHLESAYRLNEADRVRLRGHLDWLRACPPSTTGLRKQLEPLPAETRRGIARALIAIAGADGHVSPAEVKMLAKLYPLLGLDAQQVYADVHALAAGTPATILPAEPSREYAIPRPAAEPAVAASPAGFTLDTSRIAAIQSETHEVTRVLASVFADEEPASAEPAGVAVLAPADETEADGAAEGGPNAAEGRLPGLDAAHSALVRALGGRGEIGAAEFAALADAHGLMAGGAMESINDASFQLCDEPLLEGADPIEINTYAREELFK